MSIEKVKHGFVETVENGIVEKLLCEYGEDNNSSCTIYFCDQTQKHLNIKCSVYNSQYGIPVTNDGSMLFVGSWEDGLFAYDITSGRVLWRFRPGKIRNIFVHQDYLIAARAYTSVIKVDINSGKLLAEIKSGTLEHIFNLGFQYLFADTMSGKHCIIDVDKMLIVKKYDSKIVNPLSCLSLMIYDAVLQNNEIVISGFEEYPQKTFNSKIFAKGDYFSRVIDSEFIDKK
ncbi:MAG: hypothetical protein SCM11_13370 [Bacillota bacterium]|nr:hypothetical protein [Bacillota bacterium]